MEFIKYGSLENHYRDKFIQKVIDEGYGKLEYVCLEKVHGANYSFWFDGSESKTAKRSSFCSEDFFAGHRVAKYKENVEHLYRELIEDCILEQGDTLVVYGEIFGGNFFGEKHQQAKTVQGGMNYHPDTEFVAFDIMIDFKDGGGVILSYEDMINYLENACIPVTPTIFRGNLADCIMQDNTFNTKVPELFGLEVEDGKENIAEGFVIRPVRGEVFLQNDSRVIIKSKNDKFSENVSKTKQAKQAKQVVVLSDEGEAMLEVILPYVNLNRLQAVQSKIGEPQWKEIQKVTGLFVQDVLEDFDKVRLDDDLPTVRDVMGDGWKPFNRALSKQCIEIVREYYEKVI